MSKVNMLNKHKKPTCAQVCKSGCYIGGYKCVSLVKSTIIRDTKRVSPLYPSPRGRDMVRLEMSFANTGLFINVTSAGTNLDMHFCIRCEIMGGQWAPNQPMVCCGPIQCPTGGCQKVLRQHVKHHHVAHDIRGTCWMLTCGGCVNLVLLAWSLFGFL